VEYVFLKEEKICYKNSIVTLKGLTGSKEQISERGVLWKFLSWR